jgi:hypothetical protein
MDVAEQLQDTAINANCSCGNAGHEGKGYRRLADGLPSPRSGDGWPNHVQIVCWQSFDLFICLFDLPLKNLPVIVIDELKALSQQPNA